MSDVEMQEAHAAASEAAARTSESASDATEKKKALLVYKSHQHSASDDDDDDDDDPSEEDDDEDDDDDGEDDEDLDAAPAASRRRNNDDGDDDEGGDVDDDDLDDAASVKSDAAMAPSARHDDDDVDDDVDEDLDDEDDGGVHVEKDDDESINAPSDDDLDSTATPIRGGETDDDVASESRSTAAARGSSDATVTGGGDTGDTGSNAPHDSDASARSQSKAASSFGAAPTPATPLTTTQSLKTGDLSAIIAARRRTGARKECEVCGEHRNGRRAMLCASCKCMYHSSCYRQRYNKLINAQGKQWFCPDCDTTSKVEPNDTAIAVATATPRKKGSGDSNKSRAARNAAKQAALAAARAREGADAVMASGASTLSAADAELKRVTEVALRSGKMINNMVLERTDEMLQVVHSLTTEIETVVGRGWRNAPKTNGHAQQPLANGEGSASAGVKVESASSDAPPPPFTLPVASSAPPSSGSVLAQRPLSPVAHLPSNDFQNRHMSRGRDGADERDVLLTRVFGELGALKNLLEQLQVTGIQFEVDLIKEITMPAAAAKDEYRAGASSISARKTPSSAAAAAANALNNKAKNGASRLYSSKQIAKLEDWYQKSSRPESAEIQAMFRIINCPEYADKELQPDGISIKQIRIWFDNRRAKERLDYMRLKMKGVSTTGMDIESVKRMKAAYIDEAKEMLEARVSRLRENTKGPGEIVDEAGDLLLTGSGEQPLPATKSSKTSLAVKTQHPSASGSASAHSGKDRADATKSAVNVKKRIRVDFVASVRKVVKEAREAGKSEDEVKALRAAAIDRARERLHVPYKNARQGPLKPLGKDEVTHIKMKMLKLLEEDAAPEELTDVIELLMSVMIPREILIESALHRQLTLVLKAYKDSKELIKQTNKLLDEYNLIVEKGDSVFDSYLGIATTDEHGVVVPPVVKKPAPPRRKKEPSLLLEVDTESLPGTPGASPDSPAASPDNRRPRVKFSLEQLVKLEKHFHKDDTPSKKQLDKLADKLNAIGARDPSSDEAQRSIDYKQIRCWFYKRRSTNQRPQALTSVDLQDVANASSLSETESDSDDAASVSSKSSKSKAAKRKTPTSSGESKAPAPKRSKKDTPSTGETKSRSKKEPASSSSKGKDAVSRAPAPHPGRIFNVKQLATIIEEYEKNPRPSVARMNELQQILNQDDHADDSFAHGATVTKRQIKTWFSNRRAKERLDLIKMKVQDGNKPDGGGDTGDSETEDEDRNATKKPVASSDDTARKEQHDSETKQSTKVSDDVDMGSDNNDDDDDADLSSDAESERSTAPVAAKTGAKPSMSMSMLVDDDDDDDSDDDDDGDDDLDDDSDDNAA